MTQRAGPQNMTIHLRDIWQITDTRNYKVHFGRWNGDVQPLEEWIRDEREWQAWQEYWPGRDEFSRPLVFSLMQFYHETDTWLFGGVFRVLSRDNEPKAYKVKLTDSGEGFIGRLKLHSPYRERPTRVNFETHYASLEVQEILRERYSGRSFEGYDSINITFDELETLVRNDRPDWKAALQSVKGIYLITDMKTNRRYVGAAYSEGGIWARWCSYAATGHGGNAELRLLVSHPTLAYCRANFRFALLEHRSTSTADHVLLDREKFWKEILLTRGEQGLNRN